ncbi:sensor domain-containing diguanylate cyclase/phosphohydrolase [Clostridium vincentii]|uniref:Cyclic di-GMP phosphodiesterase response regulator RpfG n=1 Tax=Clostridium vincentii TaxID=52704 RepID=A0A2T0BIH4_9CLOT|nr:HD domain-containing phosphohydrolase [Clostridium vincentii]PRR83690.1 Cyclic di-GMP phosphodiesterase response regulator RpfG [Clostridium vincentii]
MKFNHLNISTTKLYRIISLVVFNILEVVNSFFYKILFEDENSISNKDTLKYWKDRIFYIVSVAVITCGGAIMFCVSYKVYSRGDTVHAIVEVLIYIIITIVITRKHLSVRVRKIFLTQVLYFRSILFLITTGLIGSGIICVLFSLILTICLLEKKLALRVIIVNIIILIILTILLIYGYLDGIYMGKYKIEWFMNVMHNQACTIILIFLMNTLYKGLENQAQVIKRSKELLKESEIKYKAIIENISDIVLIVNADGKLKYNSINLQERLSWVSPDICNIPLWENLYSEDQNNVKEEFQALIEVDGLKKTMETRYLDKAGMVCYMEITAVNLIKDPNINGILLNYHDTTQRKMREAKIIHLSYHDSLTGLYNHSFFETAKKKLDTESQLPLSVITGDINGLKIINDSLGNVEGDKLLVTIAKILDGSCSKEDIVARIAGGRFNILLPKTSREVADEILRKIMVACEAYNKKTLCDLYNISISLGNATKTSTNEFLDSILKNAEDYMYNRKLLEDKSFHSSIISSMRSALFEKSQETEEHAQRLVKLTRSVGQAIALTNQQFDELELFSTLHDIGKIGTDNQILNKPSKLTNTEWVEMKKHSEVGYRIAMSSSELMPIAEYILAHHERFDGKGYPQGLAGEDIPLLSRILGVADSYDAMTEDRVYRKGMPKEDAINEIIKNSGTQFDPRIAKIFIKILTNKESGYNV